MRKYIGLLLLGIVSVNVQAGTTITWNKAGCESVGGIWIQANKATDTDKGCDADHCNEMTFCESKTKMNWWSAFAWCESIGAKLVDLNHACPNGFSSKRCVNLTSCGVVGHTWTTLKDGSYIQAITDGGYGIQAWWRSEPTNGEDFYALCEQK